MSRDPAEHLAQTLGVEPDDLPAGVRDLPEDELRTLADAIADELHAFDAPRLRPLVTLVDRLPTDLVVRIVEQRLGPRFAARLAEHLPPAVGEALIARLPPAYLAAVAVHLELPRCGPLLTSLPPERIAAAAAVLADEQRFDTAAAVAEHLHDAALEASLAAADDASVLATVAHADAALAARMLEHLGPERRDRLGALRS